MMKTKTRQTVALAILLTILTATACSAPPRAPDLGGLYSKLAQSEDPYRNITNDPAFTDNLLYILLESPRK